MNVMDSARKEFSACFTISADSVRMKRICDVNGANNFSSNGFFGFVADADDDALGFFKRINGFAEPQIFRRAGEVKLRKFLFQLRAGADRQLRGNQNERAFRQMRQGAAEIFQDKVNIRFVAFIDRRVVSKPEHIGIGAGDFWIGRE